MGHTRRARPGLAVQKPKILRSLKVYLLQCPCPLRSEHLQVPGVSFVHQGYCLKKALLTFQNPALRCVDKQEFPKSSEHPKREPDVLGWCQGWEGFSGTQFGSATQLCPTLCNPVDCGMPGFPVLHYLPKFAQTHVH